MLNNQATTNTALAAEQFKLERRKLLDELGYTIKEDPEQPELWRWTSLADDTGTALSEDWAVRGAWDDAVSHAKAILEMSNSDWASIQTTRDCCSCARP